MIPRGVTTLTLVVVLGLLVWMVARVPAADYGEAETIGQNVTSFQELSDRFVALAQDKGAIYAFEILKRAQLPPNTDLHLLGHVVGDELYKQKGVDGIADCTQDFRNACSHTIVIGVLSEEGGGALDAIRTACHKAPGGPGAYTMCFHGLGHGVLSFNEYDFSRTQEFCKKTGTDEYRDQEYAECMGGAVMEIISGGGHDQKTWSAQRKTYLSKDQPLSLCQQSFFDEKTRLMCYDYLTPFLFEAAGADLGRPQPADYEKSFRFCTALPEGSPERDTCFSGFGKEFLVLAQDRDVRRIEDMTSDQMKLVVSWCELAHDADGARACILSAMQSAYWGGENKPDAAILLCSTAGEEYRASCFEELARAVDTYVQDRSYRENYCDSIPPEFQKTCHSVLL